MIFQENLWVNSKAWINPSFSRSKSSLAFASWSAFELIKNSRKIANTLSLFNVIVRYIRYKRPHESLYFEFRIFKNERLMMRKNWWPPRDSNSDDLAIGGFWILLGYQFGYGNSGTLRSRWISKKAGKLGKC